jgi:hypothetical protein
VFKLLPSRSGTWTENVLHSFHIPSDGGYPFFYNGITIDVSGNLFGTLPEYGTPICGSNNRFNVGCGVVYEITAE